MRHLLLALLIALLPLRGWVGDAMATQMAAGQLQHPSAQAEVQAAHSHEEEVATEMARAHIGHHGEAAAQASQTLHDCAEQTADNNGGHSSDGHCETCAACQACHTVALSPAAPGLPAVFSAPTLPLPAADQFASADAALGQKPPIS
jgi:hypothetical protein